MENAALFPACRPLKTSAGSAGHRARPGCEDCEDCVYEDTFVMLHCYSYHNSHDHVTYMVTGRSHTILHFR